jgi:hypothetical protein
VKFVQTPSKNSIRVEKKFVKFWWSEILRGGKTDFVTFL